jgi:hypothetical protein
MKPFKIKNLFYISLILLLGCNSQKDVAHLKEYNWFPFEWYSGEVAGKKYDKMAMLIPVKVNDKDANFVMQFDLGSNYTIIYGKTLNNYYSNDKINSFLIKESKFNMNGDGNNYSTKNLNLFFGNVKFDSTIYSQNYGDSISSDSLYSKSEKVLGTIGADVFKNKILLIDYPNKKMCVLDNIDKYLLRKTEFVEAKNKDGRIHIPVTINNSIFWFLFDTGSSLFPISASKDVYNKLAGNAIPTDTIITNSWDEKVKFYGAPIKEKVFLGKKLLKSSLVYFNENKRLNDFNKTEKIDGVTGNAFFTSNTIVIDFKNNRFGILK